jgi:hypothetical protein
MFLVETREFIQYCPLTLTCCISYNQMGEISRANDVGHVAKLTHSNSLGFNTVF